MRNEVYAVGEHNAQFSVDQEPPRNSMKGSSLL